MQIASQICDTCLNLLLGATVSIHFPTNCSRWVSLSHDCCLSLISTVELASQEKQNPAAIKIHLKRQGTAWGSAASSVFQLPLVFAEK